MKVISFIEQPSVIRRIIKHLDLCEDPRSPPQPLEFFCEPYADNVPWQDDVPEIEVGWDFTDLLHGGRFVQMQGYSRDPGVWKVPAKEFGTIIGYGNETGDGTGWFRPGFAVPGVSIGFRKINFPIA